MSSIINKISWPNSRWCDFLLISGLGLFIRIIIAVVLHQTLVAQGRFDLIAGDAEGYWELALDITHGRDYALYDPPRYIERMPGFPGVIALPVLVFGENQLIARMFLAILGGLTCGMVYLLGRLCSGRTQALIAGVIACLLPMHAGYSVLFLSETVFALCMLTGLCCWQINLVNIKTKLYVPRLVLSSILLGICTALAISMKPSWLLAPGGLYLGELMLQPTKWSKLLFSGTITLIAMMLCLTPWVIRNYYVSGHVVPTTLWMGPSLYDGLNPEATGKSNMKFVDRDQLFQQHSEYEVDNIYKQRAWKFAVEHPQRVLKLAVVKLGLYVKPWASAEEVRSWWGHIVIFTSTIIVLVGSLLGFVYWKPDKSVILMLTWPLIYFGLLHMIFVSSLRYRIPADYPLIIATAYLLTPLFKRKESSMNSC